MVAVTQKEKNLQNGLDHTKILFADQNVIATGIE